MGKYQLKAIRSLMGQLLRGPKRLRLRQLLNIDFLLSVIERDKHYPDDFVLHALTGYRPPSGGSPSTRLLDGERLINDLVALAEDISDNGRLAQEGWPEPTYSVADLAARFDVSSKTIFRWRRRGLVGWRFRFPDRRSRMLFPDRCVRRFVADNAHLVSRGSSFSQLTKQERERIVERARELVGGEQRTVNAVARVIAGEVNRAVETIRLVLKHYDEAHPGAGFFNRSRLNVELDDQRLAVWEAYVDGATVMALAQRFHKPVAWIYRAITQMRARDLKARRIEFVPSDEFDEPDAERAICEVSSEAPLRQALPAGNRRIPAGLPPYLAQLFRIPLLTREGEVVLFRKMNYLRFKTHREVEAIEPDTAEASELDRIEAILDEAEQVKNEIVQANLRLVVSIAKRHTAPNGDLFEIISDGNMSLMRAVDKFDYSRGFKFSTYASWAIIKNYARSIPEQRHHGERYQTGREELLEQTGAFWPEEGESDYVAAVRHTLERMLATLDEREQSILRQRYGLDDHGEPNTLEQIGKRFGVSKERIRQLESRAMTKLRSGFETDVQQLLGV